MAKKTQEAKALEVMRRYPSISSVTVGKTVEAVINGKPTKLQDMPLRMRIDMLEVIAYAEQQ